MILVMATPVMINVGPMLMMALVEFGVTVKLTMFCPTESLCLCNTVKLVAALVPSVGSTAFVAQHHQVTTHHNATERGHERVPLLTLMLVGVAPW